MRSLILVILFALGISSAYAEAPPTERLYVSPNCDAKCQAYKRTRPHGLVTPRTDLVCIYILQAKPGIVVIRFYDEAGRELDAGNKQHSNFKQADDQFCVGRHYLVKAQAGHIEVCNDVDTESVGPERIGILLSQGMPSTSRVKLLAGRFHH